MKETKLADRANAAPSSATVASSRRSRWSIVFVMTMGVLFGALLGCGAIQWIPDTPDEPPAPPTPEGPRLSRVDAGDDVTPSNEPATP